MRRIILSGLLFCLLIWRTSGADIAVPVLYQAKDIPADKHRIVGLGMYQDDDKYVWAVQISGLDAARKKQNFGAGLYFNSDNDKKTGRFAGKSGWDFQINIKRSSISVIRWLPGNKPEFMPLYVDDYLVETAGDVMYIALRKAAVKSMVFTDKFVFRCLASAVKTPMGDISRQLDVRKSYGTFQPVFKFFRFERENNMHRKKAEAVLIPRSDGVKVWNTYGERYEEMEAMPQPSETANALKTSAARGESEVFFFALTTEKPAQQLEIIPSDLVNDKGDKIPTANMFVRYIGFTGTLREEYFTDVLYPSFVKSNSLNSFVALRVNTPRNIPAGIYRGSAKIKLDGKDIAPVPLEFEVYDFDLPEQPFFSTAYCIKPGHIKKHFTKISAAGMRAEYATQQKIAREYRFSPRLLNAPRPVRWQGNEPVIDWRKFDAAADMYFNKHKFTCFQDSFFQMGSHDKFNTRITGNMKFGTPDFEPRFGMMVKKVHDHYRKLGILDKTLFIFWDEPYRSVYPAIKRGIASARKYVPDLQAGVFIDHIAPELEDDIDIWLGKFNVAAQLRLNPEGNSKKVWTYNNTGMSSFRTSAAIPRLYYWLAHKYNINGYLYSEINVYNDYAGMKRQDIPYNKWVNHSWFYPGKKPGETMASLRMELARDGLDDYDYLTIYRQLSKGKELPAEIRNMMPVLTKNGGIGFKVNSNKAMQKFRDQIAREIVKLKRKAK